MTLKYGIPKLAVFWLAWHKKELNEHYFYYIHTYFCKREHRGTYGETKQTSSIKKNRQNNLLTITFPLKQKLLFPNGIVPVPTIWFL